MGRISTALRVVAAPLVAPTKEGVTVVRLLSRMPNQMSTRSLISTMPLSTLSFEDRPNAVLASVFKHVSDDGVALHLDANDYSG